MVDYKQSYWGSTIEILTNEIDKILKVKTTEKL